VASALRLGPEAPLRGGLEAPHVIKEAGSTGQVLGNRTAHSCQGRGIRPANSAPNKGRVIETQTGVASVLSTLPCPAVRVFAFRSSYSIVCVWPRSPPLSPWGRAQQVTLNRPSRLTKFHFDNHIALIINDLWWIDSPISGPPGSVIGMPCRFKKLSSRSPFRM